MVNRCESLVNLQAVTAVLRTRFAPALAHVVASFGGFVMTSLLIGAFPELRSQASVSEPPTKDETATLEMGERPGDLADAVFPLEEYVVNGDAQWEPLLRKWRDPPSARDIDPCRFETPPSASSTTCTVEYVFTTRADDRASAHRIHHVRASFRPAGSFMCRDYVACRMSGYLGTDLPLSSARPELVIIHRASYDGVQSTDDDTREEIERLQRALAKRPAPQFESLPPAVQRMQRLLDLEKAQHLERLRLKLHQGQVRSP